MEKKEKFIVRCNRAGVFFGEIISREGDTMKLGNVRQLWYWDGAASLMQLAKELQVHCHPRQYRGVQCDRGSSMYGCRRGVH